MTGLDIKPFRNGQANGKERGFTLIESVMVVTILAIVGVALVMFFAGIRSSGDPVTLVQASSLAEEQLERSIAVARAGNFGTIVAIAPAVLPAPYDRFTREVRVDCVNEAGLDTPVAWSVNCAASDIQAKRVRVIMTWAGGGQLDLYTVITNH